MHRRPCLLPIANELEHAWRNPLVGCRGLLPIVLQGEKVSCGWGGKVVQV